MSASNYPACLAKILRYEGGYVDDPHDPGGETNYGITIATARASGYSGSMRAIPMDTVKQVYKKEFWDKIGGDALPPGLDLCVFDYAVNSGVGRAKPALAEVHGTLEDKINQYCDGRLAFMKRAKNRKTGELLWSRYGSGWSKRVADVRATALTMAKAPAAALPTALPAPVSIPKNVEDAKSATKVGVPVVAGSGLLYWLADNWWLPAFVGVLIVAAVWWFLLRPVVLRYTALGELEATFWTKLRVAVKGVKTKLIGAAIVISGLAAPAMAWATDSNLMDALPTIKGIPGSVYGVAGVSLIGALMSWMRNFQTTPANETDLALVGDTMNSVPQFAPTEDKAPVTETVAKKTKKKKAKKGRR